jgi:hypothetical protein
VAAFEPRLPDLVINNNYISNLTKNTNSLGFRSGRFRESIPFGDSCHHSGNEPIPGCIPPECPGMENSNLAGPTAKSDSPGIPGFPRIPLDSGGNTWGTVKTSRLGLKSKSVQ